MKGFTLIFISLLFGQVLFAQKSISLKIKSVDQTALPLNPPSEKKHKSDYDIQISLRGYIKSLHEHGYLSASIDSVIGDSVHKTAFLFLGQKFEWTKLHTDSLDEEILSRTGFRDKLYLNRPFNPKQINRFFEDVLTYLENTGYPFAQIKLDDVSILNNTVEAKVVIDKNQFYTIDTIQIIGEPIRLNAHYIENIIRIKARQPYEERVIKNIGSRIQENPYIDELLPFEVVFSEKTCKIVLALKPKKANSFDGIIGVQPQPDNQGVIFTGDIKIGLGNIVGQGEQLNLRWQRLQDQTQEINAGLTIPFLFKTPIGFGYKIDIYRRDTTYNNVEQQFTIPFRLYNGSSFRGYFNQFKTTLISTYNYQGSTEIPPYNDAVNNTYGIGYTALMVENIYNPYRGWTLDVQGGAGQNKILKNIALEDVNYDSISLESSLIDGKIRVEYFQPITRNTTLLFRINAGTKQSNNLVENQLYRIGGLNTIRGFDEQSIFASSYGIGTLEYRLLFDENSRISIFYDLGWYEKVIINDFKTDTPYSLSLIHI